MSSRAFAILGSLFLALVLVQAAVLIRQHRDRHLASLECHATNAGVPLAPKDGRVYVHPSGRPEEVVATGALNERLRVPAGRYDVRVLFSRSQDQQSRWLPDVVLAAGERTVREVVFAAGELSVDAVVGARTEPGRVVVYVYSPRDHNRVITSMGSGDRALIEAGSYDLRVVWAVDSREKDVRWLRDVRVASGVHVRREVAFQRGMLRLRARNAGEELPPGAVTVNIHRAGDSHEELLDAALTGMPLGLAAGRYDVKATLRGSHDRPSRWLRDLNIADGQTREETVDFSSGTVFVGAALKNGSALGKYNVYVYYYRAGDHQEAIAYTPAGEKVVLEGGRYDIRASFFRSHDRPDIWMRDVVVKHGQVATRTATFASGKLLVRAHDSSGAELVGDNVFLYLYPAGHRTRPIAVARSGEMLVVSEGVYDVRAEDTRRPETSAWLADVRLVAGAVSELSVTFPPGDVARGTDLPR
jgi:hypothetical protein